MRKELCANDLLNYAKRDLYEAEQIAAKIDNITEDGEVLHEVCDILRKINSAIESIQLVQRNL